MRILILLLMLTSLVFGYSYKSVLLDAQVSIFPRIILLDKKVQEKLIDDKIVFTIVYEERDYEAALSIVNKIDESYKGKFGEYKYVLNLVKFSDLTKDTKATAFYTLNSSKYIAKVVQVAKEKGIAAFAYDTNNLKHGLLFSLVLEKSTVLYLNKDSLQNNEIDFVNSLYLIVKFIDKKTQKEGN